jgi:hypothetical protein
MKPAMKTTKAAAIWRSGFRRTGNVIGNYLCADRFVSYQPPATRTGNTAKRFPASKLAGVGFYTL